MFLSPKELRDLTGYKQPAYQRQWLTVHGWVFEVDATGKPQVAKLHALRKLGAVDSSQREPRLHL